MLNYSCLWLQKLLKVMFSGFMRDKTMNDKFIYISNDDKQNYILSIC